MLGGSPMQGSKPIENIEKMEQQQKSLIRISAEDYACIVRRDEKERQAKQRQLA